MRIILKILAAPLVAVLFVLCPLILFVFVTIKVILKILAGILIVAAILFFIQHNTSAGVAFLIAAILISPIGIPAIAEWLVKHLHGVYFSLKEFMAS